MTITISRNSCRVCLKVPSVNSRYCLDDLDEDNKKIADKFTECSGIVITEKFNYAKSICKSCLNHLQISYNFRSIAQKTENTLQLFIRSRTENKNRVIISINNGKTYTLPQEISLKVIKKEEPLEDFKNIAVLEEINIDEINSDLNDDQIIIKEQLIESNSIDNDNNDFIEELSETFDNNVIPKCTEEEYKNNAEQLKSNNEGKKILTFEPWMKRNLRTTYFNYSNGIPCEFIKSDVPGETATIKIPLKRNTSSRCKSLVCEICGNVYQQYSQLRDHLQWHKGDKEFECEICSKQFLRKSYMLKHFKKHTGIKPFKCNFCSRTFYMNGECRAHERTHSGIRKYKCLICDKAFMYSQALKNHSLIHQEIKLYSCDECGKEFRLLHHLKQHLVTNTHKTELLKLKIKNEKL